MDSVINILPEFVANQIAAGEVVNRPASAVKELLENALDAGASDIELHIQDAGKTLIQVVDNGCGMGREDARNCFLPHATSKLSTADDLSHIGTMGFRGEALASIAAVSQVELQTRREEDETGTQVLISGGREDSVGSCACPAGSCIKVKNLYFNTPARRNFLKSDEVENRYIEEEFNRIALAHPKIGFSLYRNSQRLVLLDTGTLRHRIVQLMGKSFDTRLVGVSETMPEVELTGFLSTPDYTTKGRSKQYLFVNGRFVKHYGLASAVEKAYEGLLPEGKSPVFFLCLKVKPETIDVNIHPTKTEIRFQDERLIYGLLLSACKHALGVNQLRNTLDFESEQALPYTYRPQGYVPKVPEVALQADYNPFSSASSRPATATEDYRRAYGESFARMQAKPDFTQEPNQLILDCCEEIAAETRLDFNGGEDERAASEASFPETETKRYENPRIFQIFNSYIVCPLKSGLAVINQEAASERVIYNGYIKKAGESVPSQRTLFPQTLEFSAFRAQILKDVKDTLNVLGWEIEWVGGNSFMVNAFPVNLQESGVETTLEGLLDNYGANLMNVSGTMREHLASALAGQLAVKRGIPLRTEEMLYWASSLFSGAEPELSPSGKRILWILSEKEFGDIFK